ncbi:primase-helicase zinc-binding domain-containing protein [Endozoicomonas sp. 4G]|uniref:primase-helicase zinc-binding domain-containing protein n=1 Tax=Endozoicomonas sp. 4G TaxID=2872754 RepID=UPI0020785A5B|nr:primase-helicase zinc-binding domain-containing protein [Endozoicomonas sp. 4G]
MTAQLFTDRVKLAAGGQWDSILQAVCGLTDNEVNPRKRNIPCPHCGGRDRYEFRNADIGHYFCRHCGSGDGFSLIMKMQECRFPEAVDQVARYLGIERKPYRNEAEALAEQTRIAVRMAQRKALQEEWQALEAEEKRRRQNQVADRVPFILAGAKPADPNHPYLVKKKLPPLGLYQQGRLLLVALYAEGHKLVNLERITPEGKKFRLKYGLCEGVYHRFGAEAWTVYVCEGWATGASLYLMDSQAVRVYAAAGKHNLEAVARIARDQNPDSRLIIAADNDTHQPDNPGLSQALKAAESTGAAVLLPTLKQTSDQGTDFSDFYLATGGLKHGTV